MPLRVRVLPPETFARAAGGLTLSLMAGFAFATLTGCADPEEEPEQRPVTRDTRVTDELGWVREMAPGGALVYSADKIVYAVELDGATTRLGEGGMPEFSPDGSKVAWVRGGGLWVGDRWGKEARILHTPMLKKGGAHWLDNESLVAVGVEKGRYRWFRFELNGRRSPVPELDAFGIGKDTLARETDVRRAADGVWTHVAHQTWKTSDGASGPIGGGCACSISPDGLSITALQGDHRSLKMRGVRPGGIDEHILKWTHPGSFDNHRWSSNDPRFLVAVEEKSRRMILIEWASGRVAAFGRKGHKDKTQMYGDFTRADGKSGRPFPPLLPPDRRLSEGIAAAEPARGDPVALAEWPLRTEGMLYLFENRGVGNEFREFENDSPRAVSGRLRDRATVNRFHGLDLRGGHYEVDASVADELLGRVRGSEAFTVEFSAEGGIADSGAAVGFGDNFSIGAGLLPGGYHHYLASYSGGEVTLYVDGKPGEFKAAVAPPSTWTAAPLVLGRDWDGQLEGVTIHDRAMSAQRAAARFRAFSPRFAERSDAPRVEVDAELVAYTPPLPLAAMDTYRRCLSEHVYRVRRVVAGELDAGLVRVLEWSTLDMEILPEELKGREGDVFRLILEPEGAHPQLAKERINPSDELDPPLFLQVGRSDIRP